MNIPTLSLLATLSVIGLVANAHTGRTSAPKPQEPMIPTQWFLKTDAERAQAQGIGAKFAANGAKHLGSLAKAQPNQNIMISPYSLQECFGMLRLGTSGKSAEQINTFLGNPGSPKEVGSFSKVLEETLAPLKESDILRNANGLFVSMDAGVKPAFMQAASDIFGAGVAKTTFPNPGLKQVNGFVNNETRGKIPKIFDSLPADTVLVLVNAVSFLDTWQTPFKTSATKLKDFQTGQGPQIKTLMMQNDDVRVQHASTPSVQAISLYFNSRFKMIFILGKPGTNPVDNFSHWSEIILRLDESSYGRPANVSIPKWTSEFTWDIGESMKSQKLTAPFSPSNDFSAIADKQVFVGQAIQKTYIKVDEKGAEASAATGIAMPTGAAMEPEKKIVFNVNRPFAYAIVDLNNIPFFMGVVNDPR
jgi:serpin B